MCSKGKLCIHSDSRFSKDKVCCWCSNGKCNKKTDYKRRKLVQKVQSFVGADS